MAIEKKVYKKKRKITGLQISELSLVDFPSNQKSFYLTKRDKTKNVQDDELEKLLEGWADEALLKMTGEEAAEKLKAALTKLAEFKAELPDAISEAVSIILNVGGTYGSRAKDEDQDADDDQGDDQDVQDEGKAKVKKSSSFDSLNKMIAALPGSPFARALQKKAAAAVRGDDAGDEDHGDDADDGESTLEKLQRVNEKLTEENKRLSRQSSQLKQDDVDPDGEHVGVEKSADFDKSGRPVRDLWPSMNII